MIRMKDLSIIIYIEPIENHVTIYDYKMLFIYTSFKFSIFSYIEQVICHKKSIENLIKIKEANILNFVDFKAEFVEKNAKIKMELPRWRLNDQWKFRKFKENKLSSGMRIILNLFASITISYKDWTQKWVSMDRRHM